MMTAALPIYRLSFTAASLRVKDLVTVAAAVLNDGQEQLIEILGQGKSSSGKRIHNELMHRFRSLTQNQQQALINSSFKTQKELAFLSVCKTYSFIREFVVEEVREKVMLYDNQLSEGEIISFLRTKAESHPELEKLAESTKKKVMQVTFKILEEASIIDTSATKTIQIQSISKKTEMLIKEDNWEWLKIFLYNDQEIQQLLHE